MDRKSVSPVIAIVLLLMMTVAAAGAAYFWITSMQSRMQKRSTKSIEKVMESTGRRVVAQATLCKPTYPYKDLVGYWTFEEGSGNKTKDISGNENTGTLYPGPDGEITKDSGMWNESGQVGGALKFDGNDSWVEILDDASLDGFQKATFSAWVKPKEKENHQYLIDHRNSGENTGYHFKTFSSGIHCAIEFSSGDTLWDTYGSFLNHLGEWQLFSVVYDGEYAYQYRNGNLIDTHGPYEGHIKDCQCDFRMGVGGYNGSVDEVRIYDRVLSKNEIKELYEAENHSARRRIDVTVRNIGSEKIPKATWVANLKHDGTTVETDAYNASSIGTGELKTLKFYFKNFKPNTEYTIELQGTGTSTTVSC